MRWTRPGGKFPHRRVAGLVWFGLVLFCGKLKWAERVHTSGEARA